MPSSLRRVLTVVPGLLLLGSALLAGLGSRPVDAPHLEPVFVKTCIGYCKHPTNAGKVFRWGLEDWRQEFEVGKLSDHWRSDHPGLVTQQNGMLTLNAEPTTGHLRVWPDDQSAKYGRWEARVRAVEETTGAARYPFTWELAPTSGSGSCAPRVVLASYRPGDTRAVGELRGSKGQEFGFSRKRDLRSRAWHTYAVEITPDHISWFVDTQVVRTERRPAALSGAVFRPQFRIEGASGARMNKSRMQMDWVRYYTLKRTNAHSIKAPAMTSLSHAGGC